MLRLVITLIASGILGATGVAHAAGLASVTRERAFPSFVPEQVRVSAPFAHVLFCAQQASECKAAAPTTVELTSARLRELKQVNRSVNRTIRPREDVGTDTWSLNPATGDCEDYAITKRHELIARGWPASSLRLATAYTTWGEGHLVLVVKTSQGDMVLDNLTSAVKNWKNVNLQWVSIQSSEDPRKWLKVGGRSEEAIY